MFLAAAHVLLRETLIGDEDGIHRGHFGGDERVDAMQDGRQIRKLQLLFVAGKKRHDQKDRRTTMTNELVHASADMLLSQVKNGHGRAML